jgi:hypothetical protein
MIITLTASADASIYQRFPTLNTGYDEILEIGKLKKQGDDDTVYSGSSTVVSLINFDVSDHANWAPTASIYLNLKIASASSLNKNQSVVAYLMSSSWEEGSGYYLQQPYNKEDGATWTSVNGLYSSSVSASYTISTYPIQDIKFDITSLVNYGIYSASWNGLAITLPSASLVDGNNSSNIKVFSSQTHTIYQPTLTVEWNNQTYSTGSLKPLPTGDVEISYKNIKEQYVYGTKQNVYLVVRDKYPSKSFNTVLRYQNKYYLPKTSYYRIVDIAANTLINDFTSAATVDCSDNSNYILLDTTKLSRGRYYRLEFKIVKSNGEIIFVSPLETFTVR